MGTIFTLKTGQMPRAIAIYGKPAGARRWYPVAMDGALVMRKTGYFASIPEPDRARFDERLAQFAARYPTIEFKIGVCGDNGHPKELLS